MPRKRAPGGPEAILLPVPLETQHARSERRLGRLEASLVTFGCPPPLREFRFALSLGRQWRFDLAWDLERVALEIEGGIWKGWKKGSPGSRHTHPSGFIGDLEKYNAAARLGWLVLRATWDDAERRTPDLAALVKATIEANGRGGA